MLRQFSEREIREAIDYSKKGEQALHIWTPSQAWIDRAPLVFKKAANGGGKWAHLFDKDRERLIKTARKIGVAKIFIHDEDSDRQHIDLCGKPLERAMEDCQ